jgi:hypothetical protein
VWLCCRVRRRQRSKRARRPLATALSAAPIAQRVARLSQAPRRRRYRAPARFAKCARCPRFPVPPPLPKTQTVKYGVRDPSKHAALGAAPVPAAVEWADVVVLATPGFRTAADARALADSLGPGAAGALARASQ